MTVSSKRNGRGVGSALIALLWLLCGGQSVLAQSSRGSAPPRFLLAHYMPWYQAKPFRGGWGWHWTMNHFDPEITDATGRRVAASHFYPLIGLYDSGDPDALQCQVLLMKAAGIDGVIIDWYGNDEYYDYAENNRNTLKLIPLLEQAGMRFALCYEDQTVPTEIAGKRFTAEEAVAHGQRLMTYMQERFFRSPAYVRIDKRPVLLTFGTPYYTDAQWNQLFSVLPDKPLYFTESNRREPTASIGGFDWPIPAGGTEKAMKAQDTFYSLAPSWPMFITVAFPRFDDIYAQAGVHESWGHIDDAGGSTYRKTLIRALTSRSRLIQIATWNDWGEGTQIEPSMEFGYRDLEATQQLRRKYLEPGFAASVADLRLPVEWYALRKKYRDDPAARERLARFFPLMSAGKWEQARALLASYQKKQ